MAKRAGFGRQLYPFIITALGVFYTVLSEYLDGNDIYAVNPATGERVRIPVPIIMARKDPSSSKDTIPGEHVLTAQAADLPAAIGGKAVATAGSKKTG